MVCLPKNLVWCSGNVSVKWELVLTWVLQDLIWLLPKCMPWAGINHCIQTTLSVAMNCCFVEVQVLPNNTFGSRAEQTCALKTLRYFYSKKDFLQGSRKQLLGCERPGKLAVCKGGEDPELCKEFSSCWAILYIVLLVSQPLKDSAGSSEISWSYTFITCTFLSKVAAAVLGHSWKALSSLCSISVQQTGRGAE